MGGVIFGAAFVGVIWAIVEKKRKQKLEDTEVAEKRAPRPGEAGGGGC